MKMNVSQRSQNLVSLLKQLEDQKFDQGWKKIRQCCEEISWVSTDMQNQNKTVFQTSLEMQIKGLSAQESGSSEEQHQKGNQLNILQKITKQVLKQNLIYKNIFNRIKQSLQDTIINLQNNLSMYIKDFQYYTDIDEECEVKQTINMVKFLENTVNTIIDKSTQFLNLEGVINQFKVEKILLFQENKKLLEFIDKRKVYTDKLKESLEEAKVELKQLREKNLGLTKKTLEINKEFELLREKYQQTYRSSNSLRELLEVEQKKNQEHSKLIQQFEDIYEKVDLKFASRNDLICMIKALCLKIKDHEKHCRFSQKILGGQDLDKILLNSCKIKKKDRDIIKD